MREVGRRDWADLMPDGEGKGLVLGTCTQCHSLNSTVLQRKTAAGWQRTVQDMVSRGAQLHPQEIKIISDYLARNFGPESPPLEASGQKQASSGQTSAIQGGQNHEAMFPEGAARAIVLRSCTECHALDRITRTQKDEAGWQASVKDMIRLGAKLKPEEATITVAYLVKHFGPQSQSDSSLEQKTSTAEARGGSANNRPDDPAQALPDGEGKGLILASCVQCHNLRYVVEQRKEPEKWRATVLDMVARGTQVTKEETEIIIRYLAEHLPIEKKQK